MTVMPPEYSEVERELAEVQTAIDVCDEGTVVRAALEDRAKKLYRELASIHEAVVREQQSKVEEEAYYSPLGTLARVAYDFDQYDYYVQERFPALVSLMETKLDEMGYALVRKE